MAIVDSTGTKLTKAQLLAKTTAVAQPPVVKFTEDIWETAAFSGGADFEDGPNSKRSKLYIVGQEVPQAEIDAMYTASAAAFTSITPATGPAAGNTNVTIVGSGFSGTRGVTLGGVAATSFKVVSDTKITCKTGAHAAGAVAVVIQDASGDVTAAGAYTYV
jgi:IPT/TIG domain-containing protein